MGTVTSIYQQKLVLLRSYYLANYYHSGGIIKQKMTNPSGDRDTIILTLGGSGKMACHPQLLISHIYC